MPEITYVRPNGERHTVQVDQDSTIMEGAVNNGFDEIVAECGGAASCATCHVYVDDAAQLPAMSQLENDMLEGTAAPRLPASRLSCQLPVSLMLDGLAVHLPEVQY